MAAPRWSRSLWSCLYKSKAVDFSLGLSHNAAWVKIAGLFNVVQNTDNLRIAGSRGLIPPVIMLDEMPVTAKAAATINGARQTISDILHGRDERLLVVVGPCSIHDMQASLEYGERLAQVLPQYEEYLFPVMRVYFEKPRTTVGWKGFINDPDLNGQFEINKGLRMARELLLSLSEQGLPCGTEFLDTISPQHIADLIAWGSIGARTTESQVHRELASGLSAPMGFKNGTDGGVQVALDAIRSARASHHFLSVTKQGNTAIFKTLGNEDSHVILRGGKQGTNYDAESIHAVQTQLQQYELPAKVMIDCSHGNSQKDYQRQPVVADSICQQLAAGSTAILGVMLESHLHAGNQPIDAEPLQYGVSVTDACMSWDMTTAVLDQLATAMATRKQGKS